MNKSIILLSLLLISCERAAPPPAASTAPLKIFAASSLKETITEISGEWSKKSGIQTVLQFEASSTLARQIQEGAPADVFITAAPEWLDPAKPQSRFDWLSNRLVLVAGKESTGIDLKHLGSLSLAGDQVPAGKYAKAALAHLGVAIPERTIYGSNVRDVLAKVSEGGCDAGIVYATDAAVDPRVKIVYTFPVESHPKILYSVGTITAAGDAFARALREPSNLAVAKKRGFEMIE